MSEKRRTVLPAWWLRLLVPVLLLCGCQCSEKALAVLSEANGSVQLSESLQGAWQVAAVGERIGLGGGVRTLSESTALIDLTDYGLLTLEPNTTLRLVASTPGNGIAQLSVEAGVAILDSGARAVGLRTTVGLARLSSGTRLRLERTGGEIRLSVLTGLAQIGPHTLDDQAAPLRVKVYWDPARPAEPPPPELEPPTAETESPTAETESPPAAREPSKAPPVQITLRGPAEMRAPGHAQFESVPQGSSQLPAGTHLKLAKGAQLTASRGQERALLSGAGHYVLGTPGGLLRVDEGRVKVKDAAAALVEVEGGEVRFAAGAIAELVVDDGDLRVSVSRKFARVALDGAAKRVGAGQVAVRKRSGSLRVEGVSLRHFDLRVAAGDSLTVHDPRPPTRVGFRAPGSCKANVRVRLRHKGVKRFASGGPPVGLPLSAGAHRYELDCLSLDDTVERSVQRGRVRVLHDAGSSRLAEHPEASLIPLDGRPYTVLYQDRTPSLRLSWAEGPNRAVSLTHIFDGKHRTIETGVPHHTFQAGALPEGEHQFVFQGRGRLSRATPVTLKRDSSGPVAQLQAPQPVAERPGRFSVTGRVVQGAEVRVSGRKIAVAADGQIRIGSTLLSRPLAVWVRHPDRGTHVYLSRRPTR